MSTDQSPAALPGCGAALTDQVAIITGASRGIGKAIALAMASAGAKVVVNYRKSAEPAEAVVDAIRGAGGEAVALQADISDEAEVEALFAKTVEHFGRVHCLVANAGVEKNAPIHEMQLADWQRVVDVNLTGCFLCARAALREFLRWSQPDLPARLRGTIIAITSVHDRIPFGGHANYCASKAGVDLFLKTAALEYGDRRIRCNAIAPGAIATDINKHVWQDREARERLFEVIPFNEVGDAAQIGQCAAWLASDAASYMTGSTVVIDGGMCCYPGFVDNG